MDRSLRSYRLCAVRMIGWGGDDKTRAIAPAPPLSSLPESASTSSMSMSLRLPKSGEEETAFESICSTDSASRRSDALNSKSCQPYSDAIACASAVLPTPTGPYARRGFGGVLGCPAVFADCLPPGCTAAPPTLMPPVLPPAPEHACHSSAHFFAFESASGLPISSEIADGFF